VNKLSDQKKILALVIIVIFLGIANLVWFNYLGFFNFYSLPKKSFSQEQDLALVKKIKLEQENKRLTKKLESLTVQKKDLLEEEKKFLLGKKKALSSKGKIRDLANKILAIPPKQAVEIMLSWDEELIINVIQELDSLALEEDQKSLSPHLFSLMPKKKASRLLAKMVK